MVLARLRQHTKFDVSSRHRRDVVFVRADTFRPMARRNGISFHRGRKRARNLLDGHMSPDVVLSISRRSFGIAF